MTNLTDPQAAALLLMQEGKCGKERACCRNIATLVSGGLPPGKEAYCLQASLFMPCHEGAQPCNGRSDTLGSCSWGPHSACLLSCTPHRTTPNTEAQGRQATWSC